MTHPRMTLFNSLKSIFLHLDNIEGALFAQYNLSVARYYALQHIRTYPGLSLQELTTHLLCDKSNATRLARSLEADGLIERRPHPSDGRMLQLYLTDRGEKLYSQVAAAHAARVDEIFEPLADEITTLQAAADQLEQNLAPQANRAIPVGNTPSNNPHHPIFLFFCHDNHFNPHPRMG